MFGIPKSTRCLLPPINAFDVTIRKTAQISAFPTTGPGFGTDPPKTRRRRFNHEKILPKRGCICASRSWRSRPAFCDTVQSGSTSFATFGNRTDYRAIIPDMADETRRWISGCHQAVAADAGDFWRPVVRSLPGTAKGTG